jgi:type II secretory pathway component PulM
MMNTLTITKKIAIAAAVLSFAFSAHASNETTTPMDYKQALANLIAAQGIQVMQDVTSTVERSISQNLSEFSFSSALTWTENTSDKISTSATTKTITKTTEE